MFAGRIERGAVGIGGIGDDEAVLLPMRDARHHSGHARLASLRRLLARKRDERRAGGVRGCGQGDC